MGSDDRAELTLPRIPYFYHDIAARIIPGAIQLGLIAALAIYHSTGQHSTGIQNLKSGLEALVHASQFATALMLLAAAYFVGVVFEGVMFLIHGVGFYSVAFSRASENVRRRQGIAGPLARNELVSTCITNRYMIGSWVKGGAYAQDSSHTAVFRSRPKDA